MKRKVKRSEIHETVINLSDLGFTPTAITFMVNRTAPVVYHHLKTGRRMKGKQIVRERPNEITPGSWAAMRKLFPGRAPGVALLALAEAANDSAQV